MSDHHQTDAPIEDNLNLDNMMRENKNRSTSVFWRVFRIAFVIVLPIAILAGAFISMQQMNAKPKRVKAEAPAEKAATVDYMVAQYANVRPTVEVYGETVAGKQLNLRSNVGGEILQVSENFKSGALVNKGELLFTIDPFNYEGALLSAQNRYDETITNVEELELRTQSDQINLQTLESQLESAQKDYDRNVILRKRGTITSKALDDKNLILIQRKQAVDLAKNTLQSQKSQMKRLQTSLTTLKWSIDKAQKDLDNTKVYADFDAYVENGNLQLGQLVSPNEQVATLIDRNQMDVVFNLSDSVYGRIAAKDQTLIGREVEVVWNAGDVKQSFTATIDRLAAKVTASSGGVELFAKINDMAQAASLRAGTFVTVLVPDVEYAHVLRVPENIIFDGDRVYLLAQVEKKKEEKKKGKNKAKASEEAATAETEASENTEKAEVSEEESKEPKIETRLKAAMIKVVGYDQTYILIDNLEEDGALKDDVKILTTKLSSAGDDVLVITQEEAQLLREAQLKKLEEEKANGAASEGENGGKSGNRKEMRNAVRNGRG